MYICIDPGHGGADSGAVGNGLLEKDINLDISLRQKALFEKLGHTVLMTRVDDSTVSLESRTSLANSNSVDVFLCNHINAGGGQGAEVWYSIYGGKGKELAEKIVKYIEACGMVNRGAQTRSGSNGDYYYVIRTTSMPAVIIEFAFVDNKYDAEKLKDSAMRQKFAEAVVKGTLEVYGYASNIPSGGDTPQVKVMYRVILDGKQVMALSDYDRAKAVLIDAVDKKQATSGKIQRNTDGVDLFFYQASSGGVTPPVPPQPPVPTPTPVTPPVGAEPVSIMGNSTALASQMEKFVTNINPNAPKLASIYLEEGAAEGVRGDVAYAQAIKETGYFIFNGDVRAEQHNYGGLGATGGGARGASFPDDRTGVRAQIQHLKAYGSTQPLNNLLVDPRFNLVTRGIAPNFEDLNGRWAYPGENYGEDIVSIWKRILVVTPDVPPVPTPTPTPLPTPVPSNPTEVNALIKFIIDLIVAIVNAIRKSK